MNLQLKENINCALNWINMKEKGPLKDEIKTCHTA